MDLEKEWARVLRVHADNLATEPWDEGPHNLSLLDNPMNIVPPTWGIELDLKSKHDWPITHDDATPSTATISSGDTMRRNFTLIELLLVLAIIGIGLFVVLVAVGPNRVPVQEAFQNYTQINNCNVAPDYNNIILDDTEYELVYPANAGCEGFMGGKTTQAFEVDCTATIFGGYGGWSCVPDN